MKFWIALVFFTQFAGAQLAPSAIPENRVASVLVSQDFINAQIAGHLKNGIIQGLNVSLDPENAQLFFRGNLQVPVEELRAINLDPKLGAFRFQLTVKPEISKKGYLILEFPLSETYFYPATTKDIEHERVIVPVQMLSLAIASIRGYLSALSGDFTGFDRRVLKLRALKKGLEALIAKEKNPDAREDLILQRDQIKLQLAAIPIERKQLQGMSKQVSRVLGFTGERELNLNQELGARRNALVFKIRISQLAPFLQGLDLGGVRIVHHKAEGDPQNYMAIDLVSDSSEHNPKQPLKRNVAKRVNKSPPALVMRLNQALLESPAVVRAEQAKLPSSIRDLDFQLKEDGMHVSGKWHKWFVNVPFETTVDFVTTAIDTFEVRVRELEVAGIDFEFLTKYVLEAMKARLESALQGLCSFSYLGEKDHARALQVVIDSKKLVPAFPDLHLVDVDIREREFLLKVGKP